MCNAAGEFFLSCKLNGTKQGHHGDDHDRDQRRDQTVLDRRGAALNMGLADGA